MHLPLAAPDELAEEPLPLPLPLPTPTPTPTPTLPLPPTPKRSRLPPPAAHAGISSNRLRPSR